MVHSIDDQGEVFMAGVIRAAFFLLLCLLVCCTGGCGNNKEDTAKRVCKTSMFSWEEEYLLPDMEA